MKIISRDEAISLNLKNYFTGEPCKHGHISQRYTSNTKCVDCAKISKRKTTIKNRTKKDIENKLAYSGYISRAEAKELSLVRYNPMTKCVNGHVSERFTSSGRCCTCCSELNMNEDLKRKKREHYSKNKKKILAKMSEYRNENKDEINSRKRDYYKNNKGKFIENRKKNAKAIRKSKRKYNKNNPLQTFTRACLSRIEKAKKKIRQQKYEDILGYTQDQFIKRIEFQFRDGMSWDNRSEWHIDHKKPVSRFIEQGVTDIRIINALSNLQPLWASDNMSKGSKFKKTTKPH